MTILEYVSYRWWLIMGQEFILVNIELGADYFDKRKNKIIIKQSIKRLEINEI